MWAMLPAAGAKPGEVEVNIIRVFDGGGTGLDPLVMAAVVRSAAGVRRARMAA